MLLHAVKECLACGVRMHGVRSETTTPALQPAALKDTVKKTTPKPSTTPGFKLRAAELKGPSEMSCMRDRGTSQLIHLNPLQTRLRCASL